MFLSARSASVRRHRNTRRLVFECIEARRLLAGDLSPWHNAENPLDVTGDNAVTLADSLHIFHYIEQFDEGPVPENAEPGAPFYDTNNDGFVTNADKEQVDAVLARPTGGGILQNPKNPLDVDNNERIDRDDAREIQRALWHLQEPEGLSARYWSSLFLDPDGDGSVTPADQRLISSYLSPVNTRPITQDAISILADSDRALVRNLRTGLSGRDADIDPLRFILVSPPTHGVISLDQSGAYVYTPNPGYIGADSFTFQVDDGRDSDNLSNVATATIVVRDSAINPVASPDFYTVPSGEQLVVDGRGVFANDVQNLPGTLYAQLREGPKHGKLTYPHTVPAEGFIGAFIYTPEPGFIGTDTFTYNLLQATIRIPGEYEWNAHPYRWSDIVTVEITVGSPLQNLARPLDVNVDGNVTPLDALAVINILNAGLSGASEGESQSVLGDVSGDGHITPADALAIINHLNAGLGTTSPAASTSDAAEGEASSTDSSSAELLLLATEAAERSTARRKS